MVQSFEDEVGVFEEWCEEIDGTVEEVGNDEYDCKLPDGAGKVHMSMDEIYVHKNSDYTGPVRIRSDGSNPQVARRTRGPNEVVGKRHDPHKDYMGRWEQVERRGDTFVAKSEFEDIHIKIVDHEEQAKQAFMSQFGDMSEEERREQIEKYPELEEEFEKFNMDY